jgi:hypothetical protein
MGLRSLFAAWAGALLLACAPAAPKQAPAQWVLRDADSEIFLFGTVHVLSRDVKWRTPAFDRQFNGLDAIYLETPTDEAASKQVQQLVAELGANPAGVTLSSLLDADSQARLARVCAKLGIDQSALEAQKPWLAGLQLAMTFIVKVEGADPNAGVEQVIESIAKQKRIPTVYFETAREQIETLNGLSTETQLASLKATLRQIEEDPEGSKDLERLWASGQAKALGEAIFAQMNEAPGLYDPLITQRNARWADRIHHLMSGQGKFLIAVGAAHLAGPDSVQEMLRARGHTVEGPPS